LFAIATEVELANPPGNCRVHQIIPSRAAELRSPRQEEGDIFRTRVEKGPRFDGAWGPPNPKTRGTDGHLIPVPAYPEEGERSDSEMRVTVLKAGLNDVEEHL
jgi:hypothetical protein